MARSWAVFLFAIAGLASPHVATADRANSPHIFEPDALNALPRASEVHRIRVGGVLSLPYTDGPYLFQDLEAYGSMRSQDHLVTVVRSNRISWYSERYEAALVVITGDYRKSSCREPDAACPHLKGELDPLAIQIVSYPDKSAIEKRSASGQRPLRALAVGDSQSVEIANIAERLVDAVRARDLKTIRMLIEPRGATKATAEGSRWLDASLNPGGRVHWRLFDPESSFVSERNPRPAFRIFRTDFKRPQETERSVAICFDKAIRTENDWPDTEFDLEAENVSDPFACVTAFKGDRGWWLDV